MVAAKERGRTAEQQAAANYLSSLAPSHSCHYTCRHFVCRLPRLWRPLPVRQPAEQPDSSRLQWHQRRLLDRAWWAPQVHQHGACWLCPAHLNARAGLPLVGRCQPHTHLYFECQLHGVLRQQAMCGGQHAEACCASASAHRRMPDAASDCNTVQLFSPKMNPALPPQTHTQPAGCCDQHHSSIRQPVYAGQRGLCTLHHQVHLILQSGQSLSCFAHSFFSQAGVMWVVVWWPPVSGNTMTPACAHPWSLCRPTVPATSPSSTAQPSSWRGPSQSQCLSGSEGQGGNVSALK